MHGYQTPSTGTEENNQTQAKIETKTKRRAKDKKNHPWRSQHPPQHHGCHLTPSSIRHQIPKKRTKWSWSAKPGHISTRHQQAYPSKPKEQPVQLTPHYGTPPRISNLARGLALITVKHLMVDTPELMPQTLHFGKWPQDKPATCTCPPLPRPPPEPPNPVLTGDIHARTSSGPLQLAT